MNISSRKSGTMRIFGIVFLGSLLCGTRIKILLFKIWGLIGICFCAHAAQVIFFRIVHVFR